MGYFKAALLAKIDAQSGTGGFGVVFSGGDVSLLPALLVGVAVLVGVFVWRMRRAA